MTSTYIAPTNGHNIIRTSDGGLRINKPGMDYVTGHEPQTLLAGRVESLREYFRDERDKELGRWRLPENPDHVVYVSSRSDICVFCESSGSWGQWHERELTQQEVDRDELAKTAAAYLAAHPEKKSWHDAEDGHLYLLNFKDAPNVDVSALVKGGTFVYNDPCCDGWDALDSDRIKSARMIWPENKES